MSREAGAPARPEPEDDEAFCVLSRPEGDAAIADWPVSPSRPRLARLLGRRAAPPAPARAAAALAPILVLQLDAVPSLPAFPVDQGSASAEPLQLVGIAGGGGSNVGWTGFGAPERLADDDAPTAGSWLPQPRPAHSARSSISGISDCSAASSATGGGREGGRPGRSACASPPEGSRASSFCMLPRPASAAMSLGRSGGGSSTGTSRASSHGDRLHQLMAEAEPGGAAVPLWYPVQYPPLPQPDFAQPQPDPALPQPDPALPQPEPEATAVDAEPLVAAAAPPAATTAAATLAAQQPVKQPAAVFAHNPLLQTEQAALLSWRRNAWLHAERREPELLHRLLADGGDEGWGSASPQAGGTGRGRATGRHLAALAALLTLAVLALHLLHSHALAMQVAGEQEERQLLLAGSRVPQAALHAAALGVGRRRFGGHATGTTSPLHARRGTGGWRAGRSSGKPPRLRLRRLTLLLLSAQPAGGEGGGLGGEVVVEEWQLATA